MNPVVAQSPLLARRERIGPLVAVSAALHLAAGAAVMLHRPAPRIEVGQKPIVAKLVRLGEKRPANLLPRKEEPPPAAPAPVAMPAPPQPTAVPAPAAPVMAMPSPKAKVEKPAPRSAPIAAAGGRDVLASVLSRVKRDKALGEPVYGDPNGDPMGDSSEAGEGDRYLALVQRTLRDTYILPATLSDRDRMRLKATVVLYIDPDGQVLRYAFEERSGNGAFDDALERAIRAARLPPPPADLRERYRSEGLGVVYRP